MSCVECDDVITNPICPECLAERMRETVQEHNASLANKIRGIAIDGATKCLFCGKSMGLCAFCFSKDVYEFILEVEPALASEFMSQFNFGLREQYPWKATT